MTPTIHSATSCKKVRNCVLLRRVLTLSNDLREERIRIRIKNRPRCPRQRSSLIAVERDASDCLPVLTYCAPGTPRHRPRLSDAKGAHLACACSTVPMDRGAFATARYNILVRTVHWLPDAVFPGREAPLQPIHKPRYLQAGRVFCPRPAQGPGRELYQVYHKQCCPRLMHSQSR